MKMCLVGGDTGNLRSKAICADGGTYERVATGVQGSTLLIFGTAVKRTGVTYSSSCGNKPKTCSLDSGAGWSTNPGFWTQGTVYCTRHVGGRNKIFVFDKDVLKTSVTHSPIHTTSCTNTIASAWSQLTRSASGYHPTVFASRCSASIVIPGLAGSVIGHHHWDLIRCVFSHHYRCVSCLESLSKEVQKVGVAQVERCLLTIQFDDRSREQNGSI